MDFRFLNDPDLCPKIPTLCFVDEECRGSSEGTAESDEMYLNFRQLMTLESAWRMIEGDGDAAALPMELVCIVFRAVHEDFRPPPVSHPAYDALVKSCPPSDVGPPPASVSTRSRTMGQPPVVARRYADLMVDALFGQ